MILKGWQTAGVAVLCAVVLIALWPRPRQIAEVQARVGQLDQAITLLEGELARSPRDFQLRHTLGDAYERAGRPKLALQLIGEEAGLRPLDGATRAKARRLALAAGDPARALSLLMTDRQRPDSAREHRELVDLALMASNIAAARRLQARMLAAYPNDRAAVIRSRDLALAAGDLKAAIAVQRRLVADGKEATDIDRLVALILQSGHAGAALAVLEGHGPSSDKLAWHRRCAQLAGWAGRPQAALPHTWALFKARPDVASARILLAQLAAAHDPRTVAFAKAATEAYPTDARLRREAGWALMAAGRGEDALVLLLQAVAHAPNDRLVHDDLVALALGQSRHPMAIAELNRWVASHPADAKAQHELARTTLWAGQVPEAWALYDRLLARFDGQLPKGDERAWREEFLAASTPVDDVLPAGQKNLQRLLALGNDQIAWRRRLAQAQLELGEREAALGTQRLVAAHPKAVPADGQLLARWLLWHDRAPEGLGVLRRLDARGGLSLIALRDAAFEAAKVERWDLTGHFWSRVVARRPDDREAWESLAHIREIQGDLVGATVAWQRRMKLGGPIGEVRRTTMVLLVRQGRTEEALAMLEAAGTKASPAELRERLALAYQTPDMARREAALVALIARIPTDPEAHFLLAEVLAARGAHPEAHKRVETAVRLAPNDPAALARAAGLTTDSARLGGLLDRLAPLVDGQLARGERPEPQALRMLARHLATRDPRRAATLFEAMMAAGAADASDWFLRGELAATEGRGLVARQAFERVVSLAPGNAKDPDQLELRARALELLGRPQEARGAWLRLATLQPDKPGPAIALGQLALGDGRAGEARAWATHALVLEPASFEGRGLLAESHVALGAHALALPLLSNLHAERPDLPHLAVAVALSQRELGQYGAARRGLAAALAAHPKDPAVYDAYRETRDEAAHAVAPVASYEETTLLATRTAGTRARWRTSDALAWQVEMVQRDWQAPAGTRAGASATDLAVGARWQAPRFEAEGQLVAMRDGLGVVTPLGKATVRGHQGALSWSARAQHARWQDSMATVAAGGRETTLAGDATWSMANGRATATVGAEGGRLAAGAVGDWLGSARTELTWRPVASWPTVLVYQLQWRRWGAAGPAFDLPEALAYHALAIGLSGRRGAWHGAVQPGWAIDAFTLSGTPTVELALGYAPWPDFEIGLSGSLAGRAFGVGADGIYQRWEVGLQWAI